MHTRSNFSKVKSLWKIIFFHMFFHSVNCSQIVKYVCLGRKKRILSYVQVNIFEKHLKKHAFFKKKNFCYEKSQKLSFLEVTIFGLFWMARMSETYWTCLIVSWALFVVSKSCIFINKPFVSLDPVNSQFMLRQSKKIYNPEMYSCWGYFFKIAETSGNANNLLSGKKKQFPCTVSKWSRSEVVVLQTAAIWTSFIESFIWILR